MKHFKFVLPIFSFKVQLSFFGKTRNISIQAALLVCRKLQDCETSITSDLYSITYCKHFFQDILNEAMYVFLCLYQEVKAC
jgi:hypothetical protein